MAFSLPWSKPAIYSAFLLMTVLGSFFWFGKKLNQKEAPVSPMATNIPSPTANPSPSPTPTMAKVLTFTEMNVLYGPCADLPVLLYHHIQKTDLAKNGDYQTLTVDPETFQKQLAYLNDKRYISIGPADLIAFFDQGQSLPKKAVMLTFDDGYSDFDTVAAPLLSRYNLKATVFIPTGLLENPGYLSWSTITSLAQAGFYFGNHTWSHQNLGTTLEKIKKEIDTAGIQLTDHGQDPLKIFAYPYGFASQQATGYLKDSGYQLAFTTLPGRKQCQKQRLNLPRIRIGNASLSAYGL